MWINQKGPDFVSVAPGDRVRLKVQEDTHVVGMDQDGNAVCIFGPYVAGSRIEVHVPEGVNELYVNVPEGIDWQLMIVDRYDPVDPQPVARTVGNPFEDDPDTRWRAALAQAFARAAAMPEFEDEDDFDLPEEAELFEANVFAEAVEEYPYDGVAEAPAEGAPADEAGRDTTPPQDEMPPAQPAASEASHPEAAGQPSSEGPFRP